VTVVGARHPAALERRHGAPTYHPLPVTLVEGHGAWVTDDRGRRYLDLLSAYSALNFGHNHPVLVAAAERQLHRLCVTSRAFGNDQLGPFCEELAELAGLERVIPMNSGAEAVETAIKAARRWGYLAKGVPDDQAVIIVFDGNFHGRTTTIVGFSSDPLARDHFGPFTPGFRSVPYGDLDALDAALDERVVAVLAEPIQGEAGVVIPPAGWLAGLRQRCDTWGALLVADEIQSGLGRTGRTLACDHEAVRPDLVVLGKALGGGILPVSAVVGRADVFELFEPGTHGSTFGGNPLACAVARAAMDLLRPGDLQARSARLGAHLAERLAPLVGGPVAEVRWRGLWAGVQLSPGMPPARAVCEAALERGVLVKDTHATTVRIAPPLVIADAELDLALDAVIDAVLSAAG